jgi:integrase
LNDRKKKLACFVKYFENYANARGKVGIYSGSLTNLKKFAGKQPVPFTKVNSMWLKEFEKYMLKHISNNTTINYFKAITGALNEAVAEKIINRNPWHDISRSKRLKMKDVFRSSFTIEQLQLLANTPTKINKQYKQAYFFSCFTGLRWSDINPLRWDEIISKEIDGETNYFLYFQQEKTEAIEYLPMSDNAIDIFKERKRESINEVKSPYVFPQIKDTGDKRNSYSRVSHALKMWAKKAGIDPKKLHFHSGRHSFATNVLESSADGDLYTVSKLLGHKSITTTQIYAKVRDNRKQNAVKALPKIEFNNTVFKK